MDNVDSYWPNKESPTFTISPAPIVINRSPFIQFCNKNISISLNEEKWYTSLPKHSNSLTKSLEEISPGSLSLAAYMSVKTILSAKDKDFAKSLR